jgi:hypothetical protein
MRIEDKERRIEVSCRSLIIQVRRIIPGAPDMRFLGMGESIGPMRVFKNEAQPWGGIQPPPASRSRAQVQERAGRSTPLSSSTMSSHRLFLDRVGRHQSPSPLYRLSHTNMPHLKPRAKHDISTLPGTRHFYFALTTRQLSIAVSTTNAVRYKTLLDWRHHFAAPT